MPTYYVEDYDGERNDDEATAETKVVDPGTVEDKAVKKATSKRSSRS